MEVSYTARLLRTFAKLESDIQNDVEVAIDDFVCDIHSPHLKLHKLRGNMKRHHAFSANYKHRVVVEIEKESAYFMDGGDHSVYT